MRPNAEVVPLREYVDARFAEKDLRDQQRYDATDRAVEAAFSAAEKAVAKAEGAAEKRFESVNEFRAQQTEILAITMPRTEAEARFGQLTEKIEADLATINTLRQELSNIRSRSAAYSAALGAIVAAATLLVVIITLLNK